MKDLTQGKPVKVILLFSLPIFLGNIFQLFYSLADTWIVGHFLGAQALAAVGATTTLSDLLVSFVNGIATGFSLITASCFGAQDGKRLRKAIGGTVVLGISITLLIVAGCLSFLGSILELLQVNAELMPISRSYISVIIAGLLVTVLYNIMAATLRAVGDSVTPLIFLIISSLGNVFLDVIFVTRFDLGVSGVAYATVIAQAVSVVLCGIYIRGKYPNLFENIEEFIPDKSTNMALLNNGMSMGFMSSLVSIGTVCLQSRINGLGVNYIAGHTIARKIINIFFVSNFVSASGLATFCGQNRGAGRWDRIREGIKNLVIVNWILTVLYVFVVYVLGEKIAFALAGRDNIEIVNIAMSNLRFNILFFPVVIVVVQFRNAMQGFGDTVTPLVSSFLELVVKVLVAFLLTPTMHYQAVIICEPIAWFIMVIPLVIMMITNSNLKAVEKSDLPNL